ncbi:MAG: O-methyltransferase [Longimicrobiales bacterium]
MKATLLLPLSAVLFASTVTVPPPRPETSGIPRAARGLTPQQTQTQEELDARVRSFLEANRRRWRDMNVPQADGQRLHDLVVENGYTRALEIGTSTGHSAVWIAWALSKTGGKLITVEIDRGRYEEAVRNFEEAGLSSYIDARLADAHQLVPQLEGPFDFVFVDADKDWYTNYFRAVLPKLEVGGCFTAHNVSGRRSGWVREFLDALESTPNLETEIVGGRSSGLSVSYKRGSSR